MDNCRRCAWVTIGNLDPCFQLPGKSLDNAGAKPHMIWFGQIMLQPDTIIRDR